MIPTVTNYGNYSSSNYGAHTLCFTDERGFDFYFSYRTCVAFRAGGRLIVRENVWGPTTGKHLNWIDGGDRDAKLDRISGERFEAMLAELDAIPA